MGLQKACSFDKSKSWETYYTDEERYSEKQMLKDFKLLILWNMFHNMLNIVLGARSFHNEAFIYFNAQIFLFSPTTIFLLSLSFLYLSFMNKLFGSFSLFPLELRINYEINFSLHIQDESFTFYSY